MFEIGSYHVLASSPILATPNFSRVFIIEFDAKGLGLGAIAETRPIACFNKLFSPHNISRSTYEKEIMALVLAIQHDIPIYLEESFQYKQIITSSATKNFNSSTTTMGVKLLRI